MYVAFAWERNGRPIPAATWIGAGRKPRSGDRMRSSPRPRTSARPRAAQVLAAALLALASPSCSPPPEAQAADSVATVRSWTAPARLAGESWLQQKTPTAYTRTTLEKAETTLRQE